MALAGGMLLVDELAVGLAGFVTCICSPSLLLLPIMTLAIYGQTTMLMVMVVSRSLRRAAC